MKVLMFYDDCGHARAFDVSTPEQEYKIMEGVCKDAAKKGRLDPDEKQEIKDLLARRNFKSLYEFLSNHAIIRIGQRSSPDIVEVEAEWDSNSGIMEC
jgi:hypothetical protein